MVIPGGSMWHHKLLPNWFKLTSTFWPRLHWGTQCWLTRDWFAYGSTQSPSKGEHVRGFWNGLWVCPLLWMYWISWSHLLNQCRLFWLQCKTAQVWMVPLKGGLFQPRPPCCEKSKTDERDYCNALKVDPWVTGRPPATLHSWQKVLPLETFSQTPALGGRLLQKTLPKCHSNNELLLLPFDVA